MRRYLILTYLAILICGATFAQERPVKFSGGLLLNSSYLWRGEKVCGPNWQPEVGMKIKNFEVLFYGFLPFDKMYKELDWELIYHIGDVSLHIGDYYFHVEGTNHVDNYFDWSKSTGSHVLEGAVCYIPKSLPFYVKWMTFFYGRYLPGQDGGKGDPAFSSYCELEGHHQFGNICKGSVELGMSIRKDAYTKFTKDFAVIHCAAKLSRDFKVNSFTFPVVATYLYNPFYKESFFSIGGGIRF